VIRTAPTKVNPRHLMANNNEDGHVDETEAELDQIKNFLLTLMISRGVPMLLGGDELRRTQGGNNNAYCQDNETSWPH